MHPTRPTSPPFDEYIYRASISSRLNTPPSQSPSGSGHHTRCSSRSAYSIESRYPASCHSASSCYSTPSNHLPSSTSSGSYSATRHTCYPNSLDSQESRYALPADLTLFDPRPRQNMLGDLEIIFGKELKFPFLEKFTQRKSRKVSDKSQSIISTSVKERSRHLSAEKQSRKLKKHNDLRDGDMVFEQTALLGREKGRGVKEGNWI